jgi:hypothetical protein
MPPTVTGIRKQDGYYQSQNIQALFQNGTKQKALQEQN